jgi:hypothetical protein
MKKLLCIYFLFISFSSFCQDVDAFGKQASKESQAHYFYRQHLSEPPYGLKWIKEKISHRKYGASDTESNRIFYQSLSLREKFTYNMIHAESYSQICSAFPMEGPDEEKKIFAQLPIMFGEYKWSEKQQKFFSDNRDSVIYLMKECISKTGQVGLNFKKVIVNINAKEMVLPFINLYHRTKKDRDILTVLMLLMKNNKYQPFVSTAIAKKLYGAAASYKEFSFFKPADQEQLIEFAGKFYNDAIK